MGCVSGGVSGDEKMTNKECVKKVFGGLFAKPKDGKVYPMEPKVEKDLIGYAKKKLGQP